MEKAAKVLLVAWCGDAAEHRYPDFEELGRGLKAELTGKRENHFFKLEGENLNIEAVIFRPNVATDSIGWTQGDFFRELGHPTNRRWLTDTHTSKLLAQMLTMEFIQTEPDTLTMVKEGLRRRAEQEYLLANTTWCCVKRWKRIR
jgi:hypothetical protein